MNNNKINDDSTNNKKNITLSICSSDNKLIILHFTDFVKIEVFYEDIGISEKFDLTYEKLASEEKKKDFERGLNLQVGGTGFWIDPPPNTPEIQEAIDNLNKAIIKQLKKEKDEKEKEKNIEDFFNF